MKLAIVIKQSVQSSRLWLTWIRTNWPVLAVSGAVLTGLIAPLGLLITQRFHHDEALYATWALQIVSGENPWLREVPVDKPPFFLYTLAGAMQLLGWTEPAARTPSLVATVFTIGLTFFLGRAVYGVPGGVLAAWLVALSPFTVLFAPTALTDPILVAWVLAGCLAAVYGWAGWAGLFLGIAIATKQQGLLFIPLVLGFLGISAGFFMPGSPRRTGPYQFLALRKLAIFCLAMLLAMLPPLLWDMGRSQSPGFWSLSLINYGGLDMPIAMFSERWVEFVSLLYYATASPLLNLIFLAGLPLLLLYDIWQLVQTRARLGLERPWSAHPQTVPADYAAQSDWLLTLFGLLFLLGHAYLSFQVWDRYLLGLIPFLGLLLARILLLPWSIFKQYRPFRQTFWFEPTAGLLNCLVLILLLAMTLSGPLQDAANGRYPLGSNSGALQGIEQITAYLQGHVGANNTLYHRWLGPHWRFYLWNYPYDLQFWDSPQLLAARAKPGELIAFPTWHSDTEVRLALIEAGLELRELARAYRASGVPSVILYRIEPVTE